MERLETLGYIRAVRSKMDLNEMPPLSRPSFFNLSNVGLRHFVIEHLLITSFWHFSERTIRVSL